VIDAHLKKQGTPYLVGDKVTYADLAWIPWYRSVGGFILKDWNVDDELPQFAAWRKSLLERPAVQQVYAMPDFNKGH
jgi:glutathione S-transferase